MRTTDCQQTSSIDTSLAGARAELRVVAAVLPLGRWGVALAKQCGVTAEHLGQDDLKIIFVAFSEVHAIEGAAPDDRKMAASELIRSRLIVAGLWDADDHRLYGDGMQWGLERLVRLFHGMSDRDAEAALPALAAKLLSLQTKAVTA